MPNRCSPLFPPRRRAGPELALHVPGRLGGRAQIAARGVVHVCHPCAPAPHHLQGRGGAHARASLRRLGVTPLLAISHHQIEERGRKRARINLLTYQVRRRRRGVIAGFLGRHRVRRILTCCCCCCLRRARWTARRCWASSRRGSSTTTRSRRRCSSQASSCASLQSCTPPSATASTTSRSRWGGGGCRCCCRPALPRTAPHRCAPLPTAGPCHGRRPHRHPAVHRLLRRLRHHRGVHHVE